jgi:uncharacterized protein YuzE
MSTRKLTRSEWHRFCDRLSQRLRDESAELEVVSLALGDRIEAKWLPLYGVAYDPRADVIEIALQNVDHMIEQPRDVTVEETPRGLVAIEITTADERHEILKLRRPLRLAAGVPEDGEEQ